MAGTLMHMAYVRWLEEHQPMTVPSPVTGEHKLAVRDDGIAMPAASSESLYVDTDGILHIRKATGKNASFIIDGDII